MPAAARWHLQNAFALAYERMGLTRRKRLHNRIVGFAGELPAERAWHTISGRFNGYSADDSNNPNEACGVQLELEMIITVVFHPHDVVCIVLPLGCKAKEGAFMVRDSRHPGVYTVSVFTRTPG